MSKDTIPDFDTNDVGNSDIGGIGLNGTDSAGNLVRGIKKLMSILKLTNNGVAPLDDTFALRNATDTTKTMKFDLSGLLAGALATLNADLLNYFSTDYTLRDPTDKTKTAKLDLSDVPAGFTRILSVERLRRNGAYIQNAYTANATHTFSAASKYFQLFAVGPGGGGGGVDGQGAGTKAAAAGGGSGFYGESDVLTIGSITAGAITIGAPGAGGAGAGGSNGANGGNVVWADGTNTLTWGGGKGGPGAIADTGTAGIAAPPTRATASATLYGTSHRNTFGFMTSTPAAFPAGVPVVYGGIGADSELGQGGAGGSGGPVSGGGSTGSDAFGYGAGGGGAAVTDVTTNYAGGAGSPGLLIVREW